MISESNTGAPVFSELPNRVYGDVERGLIEGAEKIKEVKLDENIQSYIQMVLSSTEREGRPSEQYVLIWGSLNYKFSMEGLWSFRDNEMS